MMTVPRKAFLVSILGLVLLALSGASYFHAKNTISKQAVSQVVAISSLSRALRPIYPYSVIPGGAFSPTELRSAAARDPHVGRHYNDFDLRHTRLVTLTADRYQYVSFRVKNHIFWTRKALRIPKEKSFLRTVIAMPGQDAEIACQRTGKLRLRPWTLSRLVVAAAIDTWASTRIGAGKDIRSAPVRRITHAAFRRAAARYRFSLE